MLKNRLIPVVLMKDGVCVQSKGFRRHQRLGNPITIVERLSNWASDELIYLDISSTGNYDLGRDDLRDGSIGSSLEILASIAKECFMPLAFGGGIRTLKDAEQRIRQGADKVVLNTGAVTNPGLIEECSREYGAQAVILCIDVKELENGTRRVFIDHGRTDTGLTPLEWARRCEELGAGEILIQSIDRDGRGQGYDVDLIKEVAQHVGLPVIALGGVGQWSHLAEGISIAGAQAVAAANIFNYTENSVVKAKEHLVSAGLNFRPPDILRINRNRTGDLRVA